jgi:inhibitor of KinA
MADHYTRFLALGDSALTVEFGTIISERLNKKAIEFAQLIDQIGFPGFIETVPAYSSTTIFYDPIAVRRGFPKFPTAFDAVRSIVEIAVVNIAGEKVAEADPIVIPANFSDSAGPDLHVVAKHNSIPVDKVITIFTSVVYRVYMLGFLPGFSYMGELDDRISTPRKETPRVEVPKGSIGIAGRQTGIYSLASPGGWQIIGRTDVEMFRPNAEHPCFLTPGDRIQFVVVK